jgi:hypothetical protein
LPPVLRSSPVGGARSVPMTEVLVLFNYFRLAQLDSFAIRKTLAAMREKSAICAESTVG